MSTDYSALLLEYPAVISKDQLYRICHISKRKATWLLEHGVIPCKDSGKKTRRFQIYTADVVNYLITLENEPQKVAIPAGIFQSEKDRKTIEKVLSLPLFASLEGARIYKEYPYFDETLESNGISYEIQTVSQEKMNLFFGREECMEVIRKIVIRPLNQLSAEEDFILGAMLGYDICQQCVRFCSRKQQASA